MSQQPPNLRLPNQVADAENATFSVVDGMTRRPGSWIVAHVPTGLLPAGNNRIHAIVRDENESYIVVHNRTSSRANIMVLELATNIWANVTISADAQNYLDSASPDEFRFRTLLDSTLIINTEYPLDTLPSDDFNVTYIWDNYDVMIAHTPVDGSYHQTLEDGSLPAGYYQYDVDGVTFATFQFDEITTNYTNPAVWNIGLGKDRTFRIRFRVFDTGAITAATWTQATKRLVKVGAFVGYTPSANDEYINITGGAGVTAGFREIASKISDDEIELVAVTGFTIDAIDVTFDGIATQHDVRLQPFLAADMDGVAAVIQGKLQAIAGAEEALVAWNSTGASAGYFTITSPNRGTHALIYPPVATGLTPEEDLTAVGLPFDGTTGYIQTEGTGTGTATYPVNDRWSATLLAPNQPDALIDETTMPMMLRRISVGVSPSTPAEFTIDVVDWERRQSGNDITNPAPRPWTENLTLSDVAYLNGRLFFFSDTWVISSQAGDIFNLWIADVNALNDADPIRQQLSAEKVTVIDYAVAVRRSFILFTKSGVQFEIGSGDAALTPTSVKAKPLTRYQTLPVRPAVMDPSVYYVTGDCDAQLWEYAYDEIAAPTTAEEVSAHVPTFISLQPVVPAEIGAFEAEESTIRRIEVSGEQGMVFLLRRDKIDGGEVFSRFIYVYRTRYVGGKKVQSAWTRWKIAGIRGIHDMALVGENLYLLVHSGTGGQREFFIARVGITAETDCDEIPEPEDEDMPTVKSLATAQSVTSQTALQNITSLVFPIGESEEWVFQCELAAGAALGTTGLKAGVTVPAGATLLFTAVVTDKEVDGTGNVSSSSTTVSGTALDFVTGSFTVNSAHVTLTARVLNSTTAGNVQFQFAQSTSSGTALTLAIGSFGIGTKKR